MKLAGELDHLNNREPNLDLDRPTPHILAEPTTLYLTLRNQLTAWSVAGKFKIQGGLAVRSKTSATD